MAKCPVFRNSTVALGLSRHHKPEQRSTEISRAEPNLIAMASAFLYVALDTLSKRRRLLRCLPTPDGRHRFQPRNFPQHRSGLEQPALRRCFRDSQPPRRVSNGILVQFTKLDRRPNAWPQSSQRIAQHLGPFPLRETIFRIQRTVGQLNALPFFPEFINN